MSKSVSDQTISFFTSRGAEAVGGALYVNRVCVGHYTESGLFANDAGQRMLDADGFYAEAAVEATAQTPVDLEVKPVTPKSPKATRARATPPADTQPDAPAPDSAAALLSDLDDLASLGSAAQ